MSISSNLKSLISPFSIQSEIQPTEAQVQSLKDLLQNRDTAVALARNFGAPNGGTSEIQAVVHELNDLLQTESIDKFDNTVNSTNPNEESYKVTKNPIKEAVAEFIKNLVDYMKSPEAILRKITGDYSKESKPIYQIVA